MTSPSFNIIDSFLESVKKFPEKTALIEGNQKISYAGLLERIQQKAAYFRQKGIGAGDRILVFVPMSIELYETVLALFYLGAVAVFLDEWVNKKRLDICCRMAGCKGFIAPRKIRWLARTSAALRKIPVWLKTKKYHHEKIAPALVGGDSTALITFTTGSTGIPKAANRTHTFLHEQFKALLHEIRPHENDVDMPTLPIVLLMNLGAGCTSVIPSFSSARPQQTNFSKIVEEIQVHGVNRIESSPDFLYRLSTYVLQNNISLQGIQHIFTGGAPVFPIEAQQLQKAFPGAGIHIVYGSTEAEPVALISAHELIHSPVNAHHALPVGKIYPNARVMIIPIQNEALELNTFHELEKFSLPAGQVGEIIVSGHHVLSGYIGNPEAIKRNKIFVEGICWHRTGDSGALDEKGNLWLCGRTSLVFEKNGITYYPFTIEKLIRESGLSPMGTVMLIQNQVVVFAEGPEEKKKELENYLRIKNIQFNRVMMLKQVPRDKRHFSKIEYGLLFNQVNKGVI